MRLRTPSKTKWHSRKPKIKLKAHTSRSATSQANEEDLYPDQEDDGNSMKLSHAFFVVLILHLILIGGIFGFNYLKARKIPSLLSSSSTARASAAPSPSEGSSTTKKNVAPPPAAILPQQDTQSVNNPLTSYTSSPLMNEEVQAPPPAPPIGKTMLPPKFRTHRVTKVDTLQKIATAYGVTPLQIQKVNKAMKNLLTPGQLLRIPPRTTTSSSTSPNKNSSGLQSLTPSQKSSPTLVHPPSKTEKHSATYVVVRGDNPYSIARKLKISYVKLLSFNNIQDPTKLQIGTQLKIPTKD